MMEKPLVFISKFGFLTEDGTVQSENTYYRILKVTGQVWES